MLVVGFKDGAWKVSIFSISFYCVSDLGNKKIFGIFVSVTWQSHFDWLPSWPWWNPNEILRFVFCLLEMSGKHIRLGIADVDHIDDKYHPLPPPTQNEYRLMEVLCWYGPVLIIYGPGVGPMMICICADHDMDHADVDRC